MANWGMVRSFDIDDGQLNGLSPQECFVLGYELALIDARLDRFPQESIAQPVHSANADRIRKSLAEKGRRFTLTWPHDDASEQWMQLDVAPEGARQ